MNNEPKMRAEMIKDRPGQCEVCKGDGWLWADIPEDRCKACLGTGWAKTDLERAEHEVVSAERDLDTALGVAAAAVKRRDRALVARELLKRKILLRSESCEGQATTIN